MVPLMVLRRRRWGNSNEIKGLAQPLIMEWE